jgi:hypothetical protein
MLIPELSEKLEKANTSIEVPACVTSAPTKVAPPDICFDETSTTTLVAGSKTPSDVNADGSRKAAPDRAPFATGGMLKEKLPNSPIGRGTGGGKPVCGPPRSFTVATAEKPVGTPASNAAV